MSTSLEKFTISQAGILIRNEKSLILEPADRPGHWLFPGGRIDSGEDPTEGFRREIREELGFESFEILALVDVDVWYHGEKKIPSCGIIRLIKNDGDPIQLSDEHTQSKWITLEEVDSINFIWPSARSILKKAFAFSKQYE